MFEHFRWRHIPALYFGCAFCVGAILSPLRGSATTMALFGFPPNITTIPETWPVWQAGQGRIILLGVLMHVFYWRRQYAACDTILMGTALLGINDCLVARSYGDTQWAAIRLIASFAFASTGYFGWTAAGARP